jgi:hypothetical protein
MNEQDLRVLVREAIERHLGRPAERVPKRDRESFSAGASHASHIILHVTPGSEIDDGRCLIEPSVQCNHCGFCQSYGH